MAKISLLPAVAAADVDGFETLPVVKDLVTKRASLQALAQPTLDQAALLRDQAADLVDPQNIFIDIELAAAEGEVAPGTCFKIIDSATGLAQVYRREAEGSTLLYAEATGAALGSQLPGKGAQLVATEGGGFVQDAVYNLFAPILPDAEADQSAAFQYFADQAAATNRDLHLTRPGTYKLANVALPPRADGGTLRIRCADGVVIDGDVLGNGERAGHIFILAGTGIDFEGGAVRNATTFAGAVETASADPAAGHYPAIATVGGPINRLRIVDVDFGDSVRIALFYIAPTLANVVDRIELRGWTIEGAWCVANVAAPYRHLKIDDIHMKDCDPSDALGADGSNLSAIFCGIKIGRDDAAAQALVQKMEVSRVTVDGIHDNRDTANGDYNTNGLCLVGGRNLDLKTIAMSNVSSRRGEDCEGLYLKVINWTASNLDMTDAGTHGGMVICKGNNYADEADDGGSGKAIGRGGHLSDFRCTNTRAFGDVHPVYGYDYTYAHPTEGDVNVFAAVFMQHDELTVENGVVTGCGADSADIGAIYSADSRELVDIVVRNVTFRASIGRSNVNIAHSGEGGGVIDCNSYDHDGSQLTAGAEVVNVLVRNQHSGDLQNFHVERNFAAASTPSEGGVTYNVRVVAAAGLAARRTRALAVIGNRGRNLDFGDSIEIEAGAVPGTIVGLHHEGADYQLNVGTPVQIADGALFQRVGQSAKFMVGSAVADLNSKAAGGTSAFNVTVPGARVGDEVTVVPELYNEGFTGRGDVTADNTAKVVMTYGSAFDPPSQRYRVGCTRNRSAG